MATVAKSSRSTTITLASDTAGPFDLTFRLFDDDGIKVYVNDVPRTDWTLSSTYVDGYDDNATVTFDAALTTGDVVVIDSSLTPGRAQDYLDGPNLTYLQNIELGRIWAAIADINRDVSRAVKFFGSVSPVALQAGRMLVVNDTGDNIALGATAAEIPAAEGHAQKAKQWAEEDEDVEVETGEYSAKHHSAKSQASATAAQASATAAAASAASVQPTQVIAVSSDRTIVAGDNNAILNTDARRTLTLPVPTALGNGFDFSVQGGGCALTPAIGTTVTLIGDNQTFTSVEVPPGQVAKVFTDGTDWFVYFVNLNHKHVISIDPIGPDVPFVDVTVPYGVRSLKYRFDSFIPQVDTGYLAIQVGNSGGLETGGASYFTMSHGFASGTGTGTTAGGFIISEQGIVPNTAGQEGWGSGRFDRFYSSLPPVFEGRRAGVEAGPTNTSGTLYGRMTGVVPSAADRIRVLCNNGSINGLSMTIEWDI